MLVRYGNDSMDSGTISRISMDDTVLPLHSLSPQLFQNIDRLVSPARSSWNCDEGRSVRMNPSARSPASSSYSTISSRSSYCQDYFTEICSVASTAPSSPMTPQLKPEFPEKRRHSLPRKRKYSDSGMDQSSSKLAPIRHGSRGPSDVSLPGCSGLLTDMKEEIQFQPGYFYDAKRAKLDRKWGFSIAAQAPKEVHRSLYRDPRSPRLDVIVQNLNRMRRGPYLDIPAGLPLGPSLHIVVTGQKEHNQKYYESAKETYRYRQVEVSYPQDHREPSGQDCGVTQVQPPHCNKRYTKEQMEYIRYYKCDLKMRWDDIRDRFGEQFPDEEHKRGTQGVQGSHYRWNKFLPVLDLETNKIQYMPNGHMIRGEAKERAQGDNRVPYGLINLFPEVAMTYSWVRPEDKLIAAELLKTIRGPERETARLRAVKNGTWEKVSEECACCIYFKRTKV